VGSITTNRTATPTPLMVLVLAVAQRLAWVLLRLVWLRARWSRCWVVAYATSLAG